MKSQMVPYGVAMTRRMEAIMMEPMKTMSISKAILRTLSSLTSVLASMMSRTNQLSLWS